MSDAMETLLPVKPPPPGSLRGTPQLLVGPCQIAPTGSPATLLRLPTLTGSTIDTLFTETTMEAVERLYEVGEPDEPMWPRISVRDGRGYSDGRSVDGAEGLRFHGTMRVSWTRDAAGAHLCVVDERPGGDLSKLLAPLSMADVLRRWADKDEHEDRWVRENIGLLAGPNVKPPGDATLTELRRGLAYLAGFRSVNGLIDHEGYDPWPVTDRSSTTFKRSPTRHRLPLRFDAQRLAHHVAPTPGPGGILDVVGSGELLSTRRRRARGIPRSVGTNPDALERAGAAHLVFAALEDDERHLPTAGFVWEDPGRLFGRTDAVALADNPFTPVFAGVSRLNPESEHDPTGRVLDRSEQPLYPQVAVFGQLDLFGPWGPDTIVVSLHEERDSLVRKLKRAGIVELRGRPVDDAVVVNERAAAVFA